eukprot:878459-Pyramimonas_sp.AAC.1
MTEPSWLGPLIHPHVPFLVPVLRAPLRFLRSAPRSRGRSTSFTIVLGRACPLAGGFWMNKHK